MPSIISSPRGHRAFQKLTIQDGSGNDVELGADANGLTVGGKITLNSASSGLYLSANTTGYIPEAVDTLPTTDTDALLAFISNSTGNYVAINQTGTTWYYLNVTTVAPTVGG